MAYVNGTTHYNLPQTVGTDKRDWADTNQAFADVDAALYGAVDDVAQAQTEIDALTGRMNTAEENISDNTADITGLDTRLTTAEGAITSQQSQITDLRQDTEDMICAFNEPSATSTHAYAIGDYFIYNDVLYKATQAIAIGDTIVPDTNCSTTNVTTELLTTVDLSDEVTQLQTDVGSLQTDVGDLQTALNNYYILDSYDVTGGVTTVYAAVMGLMIQLSEATADIKALANVSIFVSDKTIFRLTFLENQTLAAYRVGVSSNGEAYIETLTRDYNRYDRTTMTANGTTVNSQSSVIVPAGITKVYAIR